MVTDLKSDTLWRSRTMRHADFQLQVCFLVYWDTWWSFLPLTVNLCSGTRQAPDHKTLTFITWLGSLRLAEVLALYTFMHMCGTEHSCYFLKWWWWVLICLRIFEASVITCLASTFSHPVPTFPAKGMTVCWYDTQEAVQCEDSLIMTHNWVVIHMGHYPNFFG